MAINHSIDHQPDLKISFPAIRMMKVVFMFTDPDGNTILVDQHG